MKTTAKGMLKTLATRSVIAAIPVAMVTAYASNGWVPTPPRMASYAIDQVAEITVSSSTVGIAASPLYGQSKAAIDAQLDQLQALGVQNIRVFVPWGSIDFFGPSDPGSPSWAALDLVMQAAKERNMGVLAEINSTPPSGAANGTGSIFGTDTPDPAKYAAFLTKFVGAYGDEVSAYEIWNEPNSIQFSNPIDPAAYAALVKAAYEAIKPLDPTATVIAGAVGHVFTTGATMDPVDFVKAMIAADPTIGNYFDALSYHPYDESLAFSAGNVDPNSGGFAADTAYNQLKDLVALFPTKKVWLSEFGVPTYTYTDQFGTHTVTQQQQEDLIKNLITTFGTSFGQNAGPIFLYTGQDTLTGSPVADNNYGLFDSNGNPKQVVTDFLKQWYIDHPQNATTPPPVDPPPTDPNAALQAALQAFANQIAQAFANAIAQAFATTLGQQIANAIVGAIANALASLGQPAAVPAAAPLSLRVASVAATDTTAAGDPTPTESPVTAEATTAKKAVVSEPAVAAEAATAPAATTPAATEPAVATVPAATVPAATVPAATAPAATAPAATAPAASAPAVTAPAASAPAESAPAASTPAASTGTAASTPSKADSDSAAKAGDAGSDGKSDSKASDSKGSDAKGSDAKGSDAKGSDAKKSDSKGPHTGRADGVRHGKDKGDDGASPAASKATTGGEGTAAGASAAGASAAGSAGAAG